MYSSDKTSIWSVVHPPRNHVDSEDPRQNHPPKVIHNSIRIF